MIPMLFPSFGDEQCLVVNYELLNDFTHMFRRELM